MTKRWMFWIGIAFTFLLFLYGIREVLLPFVLGVLTAYFLDPAADRMERWGFSRSMATLVITGLFFSVILALSILIMPIIVSQLSAFLADLPRYAAQLEDDYGMVLAEWLGMHDIHIENLKTIASNLSGVVLNMSGNFITGLLQSGMAVVTVMSLLLITPVVTFYLLRDWDRLVARLHDLLPRPYEATIRQQLLIIDRTLAGFIRGQLNVCLLLAVFYAVGLSLTGLKFAILIGMMSGFMLILPYIGAVFSAIVALTVAFFQFGNWHDMAFVLGVYMAGQVLEGALITPKLVGDKVGLHPVWIIFGMLAGGALFGFVGILIAVPFTAVVGVVIRFAIEQYLRSGYYSGAILPPRL
ncbi:MAG: AI-2E family transporter [Rickettsiales bacterium]|nr:AI-2E family transporter [Rickettsiales bacterium]